MEKCAADLRQLVCLGLAFCFFNTLCQFGLKGFGNIKRY